MFNRLSLPILALPRTTKRLIALSADVAFCVLALWLALYLRTGEFVVLSGNTLWAAGLSVGLALPIFVTFGLYRAIFRYAGFPAMFALGQAIALYGVLYAAVVVAIGIDGVPRTVGLIQPMLLFLLVGSSRALARFWLGGAYRGQLRRAALPKALIYGAGSAGRQLASALSLGNEMQALGFVDDDERLHGHLLNGVPIYSIDELPGLIASKQIIHLLLAIPSASRQRRNEILQQLSPLPVVVRTLPGIGDLAEGRVTVSDLKELEIDDLLGRDPVQPNGILINRNTHNKVVLVTGAGGSIGSELCRQILRCRPERLLLIDNSEFALYTIHQELTESCQLPVGSGQKTAGDSGAVDGEGERDEQSGRCEIVPLLASVLDEVRMGEIMDTWSPHTLYHAAAYKHVPLVEENPAEGVRNNVWGTWTTARMAALYQVENFILISTDKAVRPTNVMGASKRLAEMVLQAMNELNPAELRAGMPDSRIPTCFSMVRFGNVLGSSGSVVPRFRQQIREGGPITLTHSDINRFFMNIPEAAQLVIQAGAMSSGGDVFVLDMGKPVRIYDLARKMVELSGLTVRDEQHPEGEIEIKITGLRPGEKLYEELLIGNDPRPTQHPRIMKAHEKKLPYDRLQDKLGALEAALSTNDVPLIRLLLQEIVTDYTPSNNVVDWVYREQNK